MNRASLGAQPAVRGVAVALWGTVNLFNSESLRESLGLNLTPIVLVICLGLCGIGWLSDRLAISPPLGSALLLFVAFVPAVSISYGLGQYQDQKVVQLFTLSLLCIVAPILLLTEYRSRAWFLGSVAATGLGMAIWLLLGGRTGLDGRTVILDINPISIGRLTGAALIILATVALHARGARRATWLALAAVCGVGTFATGSRGPALAAAAAAAVALLTLPSSRRVLRFSGLLAIGVLAATVALRMNSGTGLLRFSNLESEARSLLWQESMQLILEKPLGVGWGNLAAHLTPSATIPLQGPKQYPHNILLEVGVEGGWLALAAFAGLMYLSYKGLRQAERGLVRDALLTLWLYALGIALLSSDLIGNRLTLVMLGVGLSYRVHAVRARRSKPRATPVPLIAVDRTVREALVHR